MYRYIMNKASLLLSMLQAPADNKNKQQQFYVKIMISHRRNYGVTGRDWKVSMLPDFFKNSTLTFVTFGAL